jgi:hypothetical protein
MSGRERGLAGVLSRAVRPTIEHRPIALANGSAQAALAEVERLLSEQQAATETLRARLLQLELERV